MVTCSSNIKLKILNESLSLALDRAGLFCTKGIFKKRTNIFSIQVFKVLQAWICALFHQSSTALLSPRQLHRILLSSHPPLNLSTLACPWGQTTREDALQLKLAKLSNTEAVILSLHEDRLYKVVRFKLRQATIMTDKITSAEKQQLFLCRDKFTRM